mmetsp:Transcript_57068/g.124869  ORF Transcript_57068/g.124869 Transcript_57068/m.124869 type:complete len:443 (+) Transcript_57068:130-1458(+)
MSPAVPESDSTMKEVSKMNRRLDEALTAAGLLALQIFVVIVAGVADFHYTPHLGAMEYGFFRDVSLMIFFGFGFLMTFLHSYGLSAIGYCLVISAVVVECSMAVEYLVMDRTSEVSIETLLNGLFCAGAVMISYGAVLGKVTPFQLLSMAALEVVAFWLNFKWSVTDNVAHDVGGGMVIHTFGAYFGLSVSWWVSQRGAFGHKAEASIYSSDLFSLAGTIILWVLWPSFQSAVAGTEEKQMLAAANTFLSLCSSTLAFAIVSRFLNGGSRFNVVHLQNATLAGGVVMGVAGDLDMGLPLTMSMGFVAGALSCVGYAVIQPLLEKLLIHDTCGVNNLHGMPGVLGSVLSIILVASKPEAWAGEGVTATTQLSALLITLGVALAAGNLTGLLISMPLRRCGVFVPAVEYFSDASFFEMAPMTPAEAGKEALTPSSDATDARALA